MHGMDSRFHGNDIDLLRLLANYEKLDSGERVAFLTFFFRLIAGAAAQRALHQY
jgi:hypothetical protein